MKNYEEIISIQKELIKELEDENKVLSLLLKTKEAILCKSEEQNSTLSMLYQCEKRRVEILEGRALDGKSLS